MKSFSDNIIQPDVINQQVDNTNKTLSALTAKLNKNNIILISLLSLTVVQLAGLMLLRLNCTFKSNEIPTY